MTMPRIRACMKRISCDVMSRILQSYANSNARDPIPWLFHCLSLRAVFFMHEYWNPRDILRSDLNRTQTAVFGTELPSLSIISVFAITGIYKLLPWSRNRVSCKKWFATISDFSTSLTYFRLYVLHLILDGNT